MEGWPSGPDYRELLLDALLAEPRRLKATWKEPPSLALFLPPARPFPRDTPYERSASALLGRVPAPLPQSVPRWLC